MQTAEPCPALWFDVAENGLGLILGFRSEIDDDAKDGVGCVYA